MAFEVIQGFNVSKNEAVDATRVIAADETAMLAIKWVYEGLRVTRLDTTPKEVWICTVAAATLGPIAPFTAIGDWEEFTGTDGIDGVDGSQIYTAAGDPSDLLGVDGDFYLNSTSGDYFTKGTVTPGEWGAAAGNLLGPQGDTGIAGPVGPADTYSALSTTSATIPVAHPTDVALTLDAQDYGYTIGQPVIAAEDQDNYFLGTVKTYTTGILTITSTSNVGTGSAPTTAWVVNLAGAAGIDGTNGADGADGDTYATSSVTSVNIGGAPATVALTVDVDLDYTAGQTVIVASLAAPTVDYFTATVTSYSSPTLNLGSISYNGTGTHTDWEVNLSGAVGIAGDQGIQGIQGIQGVQGTIGVTGDPGADGNDGTVGIALIHTESDITLDEGKVSTVQGGSWTPQAPWSASVQSDIRSPNTTPSGISGLMDKNSISYNGTVWSNNGRWVGQDGTNGTNGTNGTDGNDGDTGPIGAGVIEYHHDVTGNLSGSQVMALPYDFDTVCVLHLHVKKGKYIVLPALSGLWPNSQIREIRVTRLNPESDGPGICKVWGHIRANGMKTFPLAYNETTQPNFPELDVGEMGSFKPVSWANGGYQKWWTGQISGRGMELYSKQRDYTASSVLRTGDQGKIQGYFSMRVVDNVCHYGGWFKVKVPNGTFAISDTFQIGPENPFPYLPDPEFGVVFGSIDGTGPATRAFFPFSSTGSAYSVLSFSPPGIYPIPESPTTDYLTCGLQYDASEGLTINKIKVVARISNSFSAQALGAYTRYHTFSGSYTTASQTTATAFYV